MKLLLTYEHNVIHTLGIRETKLNEIHPDAPFEISGYQNTFRRDILENAGEGLLVYVKEWVCCSGRSDLIHINIDCIWVEIKLAKSRPFLIGNIYRPPYSNVQWNEYFEDFIENVLF